MTHEKRKRKSNVEISVPASDEDPEDARILWLETKLGMGSSSGKRSALFGDGLDGKHEVFFHFLRSTLVLPQTCWEIWIG